MPAKAFKHGNGWPGQVSAHTQARTVRQKNSESMRLRFRLEISLLDARLGPDRVKCFFPYLRLSAVRRAAAVRTAVGSSWQRTCSARFLSRRGGGPSLPCTTMQVGGSRGVGGCASESHERARPLTAPQLSPRRRAHHSRCCVAAAASAQLAPSAATAGSVVRGADDARQPWHRGGT
eukprot:365001-Chlamydomonas_euryale.AAC.8